MNLDGAYDLMDLLLDKADQPYFTTEEKDKFLNLAISDFINGHYQKMTADEDSRRALSGCINWRNFSLSKAKIIDGTAIYDNSYPALSEVYDDTTALDTKGYFKYGNHYVLPKQHLYVLSLGVGHYNKDEVINPSDGTAYSGVTEDDIIFSPTVSAKNKSTREYYEHAYTKDPFNKPSEDAPYWSYIENRIVINGAGNSIKNINIQVITLPTAEQAFSESTYGSSTAPEKLVFAEHYQKQIVQLAVERMTRVDVGLMTPPS
jgi:hypothetical protein